MGCAVVAVCRCCGCGRSLLFFCFFFKQKTAYEMRISDWSSDVCSSDLLMLSLPFNSGLYILSTLAVILCMCATWSLYKCRQMCCTSGRKPEDRKSVV